MNATAGRLYGVGVGPGDPELMTLKAARILREAGIIAYFSKNGSRGHAHAIATSLLNGQHEEFPMVYPVTTEFPVNDTRYINLMSEFYESICQQMAELLTLGKDVAVLCEGDPFFYGSFMHIYRRLSGRFACQVIPGVTAMSGGWTNAGHPITWGNDVLTVLPGTLESAQLTKRLQATDAAVIMKIGRHLPRVREAVKAAGMHDRAIYIEYGTMEAERILPLAQKTDDTAPYFSLIIVPGNGRRL